MANFFTIFRKNHIPVINWSFFTSLKEGKETFNSTNWSGWNTEWSPIATTELGDAIIIYNSSVYEVQHGAGKSPKPRLVTEEISSLELLLKELKKYKGCSESEPIEELRKKKEILLNLKKKSPRALKYDFNIEIDSIKDIISDIRSENSKEGKFFKAASEMQKTSLAELRENGRYSNIRLQKRENKFVFYIWGSLKKGESVEEIKKVLSKYPAPYPVEFEC